MQISANPVSSDARRKGCGNFDDAFTPARLVLVLGVLMLIAFPDIVLGSHAFIYRDAGIFGYPIAYYFRDCFWRGELPLWNPYSNCGIPFLAQWNTLVLYPPSLFYLLLPMPWSLNFFQFGHMVFAAIGMYFLAHRWFGNRFAASVAGLAFAWNGFTLHALMWPSILAAWGWMPWVLLLLERARTANRRWIIWAALAGAMQMLTGAPEIILFTWTIAGLLLLANCVQERKFRWSGWGIFLTIIALVVGLTAVQLFPFFQLLTLGDRSESYGTDAWSMPPWGLANFLVPLFRCTSSVIGVFSQDEQQWTSSYYAGTAIFGLAILALVKVRQSRVFILGLLATFGILCALGSAGFALPALKKILPVLGFIRFPIKFLMVTLFCLPLLAAATIVWLTKQPAISAKRNLTKIGLAVMTGVTTILIAAIYFSAGSETKNITLQNGIVRLAFSTAIFAALYFAVCDFNSRGPLVSSFAILLLLGIDIAAHAPRQNPTAITRAYESWLPQMDAIPRPGESRAMLSAEVKARMDRTAHPYPLNHFLGQRAVLLGNCNLLEKIPKIDGFFPMYLREESEVEALFYKSQNGWLPELANFLGASQITSAERLFAWDSRTNFMPLATIGQQPVFVDAKNSLAILNSADFQPREKVYLPVETQSLISLTRSAEAKIISSQVSAHEMLFETDSATNAVLVAAQSFYPCWKTYVDEKPVTLLRANHAFQAVEVPAGKHRVRFRYEDRRFYFGAAISSVTLLGCFVALIFRHKSESKISSV